MKISEIIKEILDENNLSQEELAKILNISQKSISNWLNGKSLPKVDTVIKIYKNFNITPNELLGIEEPQNFKNFAIKDSFNNNSGNIKIKL